MADPHPFRHSKDLKWLGRFCKCNIFDPLFDQANNLKQVAVKVHDAKELILLEYNIFG